MNLLPPLADSLKASFPAVLVLTVAGVLLVAALTAGLDRLVRRWAP